MGLFLFYFAIFIINSWNYFFANHDQGQYGYLVGSITVCKTRVKTIVLPMISATAGWLFMAKLRIFGSICIGHKPNWPVISATRIPYQPQVNIIRATFYKVALSSSTLQPPATNWVTHSDTINKSTNGQQMTSINFAHIVKHADIMK